MPGCAAYFWKIGRRPDYTCLPKAHIAFAQFWEELDPQLRRLWVVLDQKDGNQVAAAKSLRVHRNTVNLWIKKIQRLLKEHGFGGD